MEVEQRIAHAPKSLAARRVINTEMRECIGCTQCHGLCAELIEALTLPDAILKKGQVQ